MIHCNVLYVPFFDVWTCSTEKQTEKTRETKLVKPVELGQFVKIQDQYFLNWLSDLVRKI